MADFAKPSKVRETKLTQMDPPPAPKGKPAVREDSRVNQVNRGVPRGRNPRG